MFPADLVALARLTLDEAQARGLRIVTAESCTGGLVAALLTEIPGSSTVLERGFVTYSNQAKRDLLGVPGDMIADLGAVSEPVAIAMAEGALKASNAHIAVAITGVAGPGGGTALKPVGLVHLAAAREGPYAVRRRVERFGALSRTEIRLESVRAALEMIRELIGGQTLQR
jgi:nicotinamide-nucleotide amidase